jgi:tight adherence protein B
MNVTHTIRSRANLYREVRIITTRQRMTSNMVAGVPVVVSGLLLLVNPKMAALLFGTTPGRIALAVGIGFELFGIFLVRKFGTIEV